MREFAHIERRIERLSSIAPLERADAWLLAEMRDVLATGYVYALKADAYSRRLGERIDSLLDLDHPHVSDEMRGLAQERRTIEDATHRFRERLGVVRSLFARVSARSDLV
jgi:hypothetical protein